MNALDKAKIGAALTLKDLATVSGYSYWMLKKWHREGLPTYGGKTTLKDAMAWIKSHRQDVAAEPCLPTP